MSASRFFFKKCSKLKFTTSYSYDPSQCVSNVERLFHGALSPLLFNFVTTVTANFCFSSNRRENSEQWGNPRARISLISPFYPKALELRDQCMFVFLRVSAKGHGEEISISPCDEFSSEQELQRSTCGSRLFFFVILLMVSWSTTCAWTDSYHNVYDTSHPDSSGETVQLF